ncbi:MAG: hypothetical protein EBU88_18740, partial [Acidobacteria bacterium]|nr:hypothetical protein [Acidobacteriota bacterium]
FSEPQPILQTGSVDALYDTLVSGPTSVIKTAQEGLEINKSTAAADIKDQLKGVDGIEEVNVSGTGPWDVSYTFASTKTDATSQKVPENQKLLGLGNSTTITDREFDKTTFEQTVTLDPAGYTKYEQKIHVKEAGYTTYQQIITLVNTSVTTFELKFDGQQLTIHTDKAANTTDTNGIKKKLEVIAPSPFLASSIAVTGAANGPWTVVYKSKDDVALTTPKTLTSTDPNITVSPVTKTQDTFGLKFDGTTLTINKASAAGEIKQKLEAIATIEGVEVAAGGLGTQTNPWVVTYTSKNDALLTDSQIITAAVSANVNVSDATARTSSISQNTIDLTLKTGTFDPVSGVFTVGTDAPVSITKPASGGTPTSAPRKRTSATDSGTARFNMPRQSANRSECSSS